MLKTIAQAIKDAGGRAFLVGGSVRDEYLGVQSKDLDVEVFGLERDELAAILHNYGKPKACGNRFGVIKLAVGGFDFDFSLPRTESKTGRGRKGFLPKLDKNLTHNVQGPFDQRVV